MRIYAQVTNQGTAMSETALCVHHLATHRAHFETDHDYMGAAKDGPRVELADVTFRLCGDVDGGNDQLACNVCGAHIYSPDLNGKTILWAEFAFVAVGYAGGPSIDEPQTTLHFTDGTNHTFIHPEEN